MSITKITYTDKQAINTNANVNDNNLCKATDMNEIKTVVNGNADLQGDLTNLMTSVKTDLVSAINEVNGKIKFTTIAISIVPSTARGSSGYGENSIDISSLNATQILGIFFAPSSTHVLWGVSNYTNTAVYYYGFRIAGTYSGTVNSTINILYM